MKAHRVFMHVLVSVLLAVLLAGCGQAPIASPTEPSSRLAVSDLFQPGWNEIPLPPYSIELRSPVAFWTGTELIVAGGYELPAPYEYFTLRTETYAYSPTTETWRELPPLDLPGHDGMLELAGAWTGEAWIGTALQCHNGPGEYPSDYCDSLPVGMRWMPEDGWTTTGPIPSESVPDARLVMGLVGLTSTTLILSTYHGYLTQEFAEANATWRFTPWPVGTEPMDFDSACLIGDEILTVSTILGYREGSGLSPSDYPQSLTVNTLTLDNAVSERRPLADLDFQLFQPYCQPGGALFVYTNIDEPVLRVTPDTIFPIPAATVGRPGQPSISVGREWIDVGTGVLSLSVLPDSFYIDTGTGEPTFLPPSFSADLGVWSGDVLFASPFRSHQWFAFLPRGTWPESADFSFPFEVIEW